METVAQSVSTTEAAKRLGVTAREVYRLVDDGDLPAVRGADGRLRIPVEALVTRG